MSGVERRSVIESQPPRHSLVMRALQLCLASVAFSLLSGCAEPTTPATEIWDIRSHPDLCDGGEDNYYFCAHYTVDGSDQVELLHHAVDGLDIEWGHSYRVAVEMIESTDGPRYELVEVIDEEVHPGLEFDLRLERNMVSFDEEGENGTIASRSFVCAPALCTDLATLLGEFVFVEAVFRFGPDNLFPLELVSFEAAAELD